MNRSRPFVLAVTAPALAGILLAAAWAPGVARAQANVDPRMQRQIRYVEHDLDDMLVDSSNFLVPGYHNARGIYVPGTGMIFTFSSSLTASRDFTKSVRWIFDRDRDDDDWKDDDSTESGHGVHSREMTREERQYKRGTDELMQLLLDDADSMSGLKPGESVELIAYFNDVDYLGDKGVRHLSVKAKSEDLAAYAAKKLSDDQAKAHMVKTEY